MTAVKTLFAAAVVSEVTGICVLLYLCYLAGLPTHADPVTGHIIELNVHGTVLFMTKIQSWLSERLMVVGVGLLFLTGLVKHRLE